MTVSKRVVLRFPKRLTDRPIIYRLVKDYDLELYESGRRIERVEVRGNHLRHRLHRFAAAKACDKITLTVRATRGDPHARVFEIRAYGE